MSHKANKGIVEKLKLTAPTIFIIFGATGDLAKNKLLPSLFDLYNKHLLPDTFSVLGFAIDEMDDTSYKTFVREAIQKKEGVSSYALSQFVKHIQYYKGDFTDKEAFHELAHRIIAIEDASSVCANKFMYLAIPPRFYESVLDNLAQSGLTTLCKGKESWNRVLIEKPFGSDLSSAQKLNRKLKLLFSEEHIFRIDHYLAKEMVQNILSFRFSNRLFESIWDNNNIERIEIKLREKSGARYYLP